MPSSSHIAVILETILATPPSSPPSIVTAWLDLVENAMVAYGRTDSAACSQRLPTVWKETWTWLAHDSVKVRIAAENALAAMLRYCLTVEDILHAVEVSQSSEDEDEDSESDSFNTTTVGDILKLIESSFSSLTFVTSDAIPHTLCVLTSMISRLRIRTSIPSTSSSDSRPPSAAEVLLPDFVQYVAQLRSEDGFEHKERANDVLGMAIEVMGPEAVLGMIPLNLLPE